MKLAFFQSSPPNFGDELNVYLWSRLLPAGFLDDDPSELFVGIGSVFGEMFPAGSIKHVIGSGQAGYYPDPDLSSGKWNVVFVRGPETCRKLGLSPEQAICDSGMLIRRVADLPAPLPGVGVAFMPHFESLERGRWREVCDRAAITLIDPTDPPERVLAQIRGAERLITEAMHGAIVADALRTPWIAVRPFHRSHVAKWYDWAGSLGLAISWARLWPSSLAEFVTAVAGRGSARLVKQVRRWPRMDRLAHRLLVPLAARRLKRVSRLTPQLSAQAALDDVVTRAETALGRFVDLKLRERAEKRSARPETTLPG